MNSARNQTIATLCLLLSLLLFAWLPYFADAALNILEYRDTISDSGPEQFANHTLQFKLNTNISPGSTIEVTPPVGFTVIASSTFAERNVELYVNGTPRTSDIVAAPGVDQVEIVPGSPGFFRYTLAPNSGIAAGSSLELRIGNHTTESLLPVTTFSTSTGTTTTPGDEFPIQNSSQLGRHDVKLEIYDGGLIARANFIIFLNRKVLIPSTDTTETIPPYRFNPAPTSTVGGTTLNVEISLQTDEFAICRYSTEPGVAYGGMTNSFSNPGGIQSFRAAYHIYHSAVVPVTPDSVQRFYVRCIDDEGNFNIDDFLIVFTVNQLPTGTANTEGSTDGDGSGQGDSGTGDGAGSGGTTGESSGQEPLQGGSSGSGGAGGGGGGGTGTREDSTAGGGFESTDAVYQSGDGRVIISGFAYPNSTVSILVDGKFFSTVRATAIGSYSVTLDEIARGVYTFGVYAAGPDGTRSSTFSTSFTVTGSRTSALSNINVAPSIKVSPDPVNPGETLTVSGYALPNARVEIQNGVAQSSIVRDIETISDATGRWTTIIDTGNFSRGTYQIRARSSQEGGLTTNWSGYTFYGVGQAAGIPINADLNRDGKVNLVDFSILLFWWNTDGGNSNPPADINRDGKVNLVDFSILLFNWTG